MGLNSLSSTFSFAVLALLVPQRGRSQARPPNCTAAAHAGGTEARCQPPPRHVQCPVADRVCLRPGQVGPGGPPACCLAPGLLAGAPSMALGCRCLRCPPHLPRGFHFHPLPRNSPSGLRGVLPPEDRFQPVAELSLMCSEPPALHGAVCRAEQPAPGAQRPHPFLGLSFCSHESRTTLCEFLLTAPARPQRSPQTCVPAGRLSRVASAEDPQQPCPAGSPLPWLTLEYLVLKVGPHAPQDLRPHPHPQSSEAFQGEIKVYVREEPRHSCWEACLLLE